MTDRKGASRPPPYATPSATASAPTEAADGDSAGNPAVAPPSGDPAKRSRWSFLRRRDVRVVAALALAALAWWTFDQATLAYGRWRVRSILSDPRQYIDYGQMCAGLNLSSGSGKISYYDYSRDHERVAASTFLKIRPYRRAAIELIREKLVFFLEDEGVYHPREYSREDYLIPHLEMNRRTDWLAIAVDLNAVELLPDLLALDARLAPRNGWVRGRSEEDVRWAWAHPSEPPPNQWVAELHAFVLSTILAILRQERFEPLLASELEAKYASYLRTHNAMHAETLSAAGVPDPIYPDLLRAYFYWRAEQQLTPQLWSQINRWAADFLREVPPSEWRAERGINPMPFNR